MEAVGVKAETAAVNGYIKPIFTFVRSLTAFKPLPVQVIQNYNGELTMSQTEFDNVWIKHFSELVSADVLDCIEDIPCKSASPPSF